MQSVRDEHGRRYLLVKRSGESSRVRDPATGEERYVENDRLEAVDESPLVTAARAVPEPIRRVLSAVHDDRALGLLYEIDTRGPIDVVALLESYDYCESELHGLLGEWRAAGLVEPIERDAGIASGRSYRATERTRAALAVLCDERSGRDPTNDRPLGDR